MELNTLTAISPIDGRYRKVTAALARLFSEFGLVHYRIKVEIEYFIALSGLGLPQLPELSDQDKTDLRKIYRDFTLKNAEEVKLIEKETNHDVKAVEYFIKNHLPDHLKPYQEFIHFGLTSQDINNTATPLLIKEAVEEELLPSLEGVLHLLQDLAKKWGSIPILSRTHGQPASPTPLGKEIEVFRVRIQSQLELLKSIPYSAKFGGATGNFNAHVVAFPDIEWHDFANQFIGELGLQRSYPTTQIDHYDHLAALADNFKRINTILIDLCRDFWQYISMNYFTQKVIANEVGSSAMPHKVNPIDFENAEGNFGMANAIYGFLSSKLPISRLQRDLTDSTVLRNVGVPFSHSLIGFESLKKGLNKISLNRDEIDRDLINNWAVVSEAIQTILRREKYPEPYEALKALTRGNKAITQESMKEFIDSLNVEERIKGELKAISPFNYMGKPMP